MHRGQSNDLVSVADIVRDQLVRAPVFAVHRLDRGTSGVLLFALDADAARFYQKEIEAGKFRKKYLALVRAPMRESYLLDHAVPKGPKDETRVAAITEFIPLHHSGRWSLVEARPLTGRYHQIRRHLKHLSHPIVGDVRYGKGDVNRLFREEHNLHRLALHASELAINTVDGQAILVKSSVPRDLASSLMSVGFGADEIAQL